MIIMDANIIVKTVQWINTSVKILGIALTTFILCLHIHIFRNVVPGKGGVTVVEYTENKGKNFYYIEMPDKKIYPALYNPRAPLQTIDRQRLKPGKIKILQQLRPYEYKGIELIDIGDCPSFFGTKGWSLLYQNRTDEKRSIIFWFGKELISWLLVLALLIKGGEFFAGRIYFLDKQVLASTANFLIIDLALFMIAAFLTVIIIY